MILQTIIASTRPARVGGAVGHWFFQEAQKSNLFDVELIDLKEVNLPLLDEAKHPMLRQYQHEHTRAWSARVARADAYVFVIPEYNYSAPPALMNAIDYLYHEWNYKPVGLVSYGGVSGGLRSAQMLRTMVTTLKMMPLPEGVVIQQVTQHINADGAFQGTDAHKSAVTTVLTELAKWATALKTLRPQGA